ncbi:hypothetical protein OXX80_009526 [Metschnikowia pulcherrima]
MSWTGESLAKEVSPQSIVVALIIRLYVCGQLPPTKWLLLYVSRYLDGIAVDGDKEVTLNPSLLTLCGSLTGILQNLQETKISKIQMDQHTGLYFTNFTILTEVWRIDSADQLLSIISGTYRLVAEKNSISYEGGGRRISQRSPIGRFVRKLAVSVKLLNFEEISSLFANFNVYRQPSLITFENMKKLHGEDLPAAAFPIFPPRLVSSYSDQTSSEGDKKYSQTPKRDEKFYSALKQTLGIITDSPADGTHDNAPRPDLGVLVENQIRLLQRYGRSTPESLKLQLTRMASSGFVHESSGGGADQGEPSSMHYLTYLEDLYSGNYRAAFDSLHRYFDYMVSKGSRYYYHFALISKASLHQYFEENGKALDSIEEAISVARENKDNSTLTYILSWLFDFVKKNPFVWKNQALAQVRNDSQLLDSLIKKSSSVSLSLAAMSYRYESEHLMNNGACFAKYFESLFKSNFLAVNDHVTSFIGACHATSNLWELTGFPHLALLYTELGLSYSESLGTSADVLEFQLRQARLKNDHSKLKDDLWNPHGAMDASRSRPINYRILFQSIESAVRKGRIRLASELLDSIPVYDEMDQDLCAERQRLVAMTELAHGNHASALKSLQSSNQPQFERRFMQLNLAGSIKSNILKSHILVESGVPLKAFSLTIQQLELAKKSKLRPLVCEAGICLTRIFSRSDATFDAYALAISMIPSLFCINDPSVSSPVFLELSHICLQMLRSAEFPPSLSKKKVFNMALSFLGASVSGFKKIEDFSALSECFTLETQIAKVAFPRDENDGVDLPAKLEANASRGLEISQKRMLEESKYGYVGRNGK